MTPMVVTRSDVARAAGVSPSVVSFVVNNGPRPVALATRVRVEAAILELGYRPNALASALREGSSYSIGLLLPDMVNPFYAQLAQAVESALSTSKYLVLTANTHYQRSLEERYIQTFLARRVDGLLLSSGVLVLGSDRALLGHLPTVVIGTSYDSRSVGSVAANDHLDARTAVVHLQGHGHQLIGCVGGVAQIPEESEKLTGWRRQQTEAGCPAGEELVASGESSHDGGYLAARTLLGQFGRPWAIHGRRPTALFVSSDIQAVGAMYACYELGLNVPDDVAVVAVGGTQAASYTTPPLTTMRQDFDHLAELAIGDLFDRINNGSTRTSHTQLRGNLVIGHSCGC